MVRDGRALQVDRLFWFAILALGLVVALGTWATTARAVRVQPDRAVVVLFRGLQGVSSGLQAFSSGADPAGMDHLHEDLLASFTVDSGRRFSSRVFAHDEGDDALDFVDDFSDIGCLVLIGHSFGADEAIELAGDQRLVPAVDLLVQIDSRGVGNSVLPAGVRRGFHYFQVDTIEVVGMTLEFRATPVRRSRNIPVEFVYGVSPSDIIHTNIDDPLFGRTTTEYQRLFGSQPDLYTRIKGHLQEACP